MCLPTFLVDEIILIQAAGLSFKCTRRHFSALSQSFNAPNVCISGVCVWRATQSNVSCIEQLSNPLQLTRKETDRCEAFLFSFYFNLSLHSIWAILLWPLFKAQQLSPSLTEFDIKLNNGTQFNHIISMPNFTSRLGIALFLFSRIWIVERVNEKNIYLHWTVCFGFELKN